MFYRIEFGGTIMSKGTDFEQMSDEEISQLIPRLNKKQIHQMLKRDAATTAANAIRDLL